MAVEIEEEKGTTLLIEGKASFESDKYVEVFGCKVKKLNIPEGKILPVYLLEDCKVKIDGRYIPIKGSTIPKSWENILKKDFNKIFIFGEIDSGKSSFATYLANKLDGTKWILDLDIGQADIAHPGAIGLGRTNGGIISLSDVGMIDGEFVGCISPMGKEIRCIRAVLKLYKRLISKYYKEGERIIVDSTGWVKGRQAKEYKLTKIEIIDPDLIVCFGDVPEYLLDFNVVSLESFVMKKRSREIRSLIRSTMYSKWFENSKERVFDLKNVKLCGTNLFKGRKIDYDTLNQILETKIVFAEKGRDFVNIWVEDKPKINYELLKAIKSFYNVSDVCIFDLNDINRTLVGLYSDTYLGPGLVLDLDPDEKIIKILTSVEDEIKKIEFGEIKLDKSFRELIVRLP